MRRKVQRPTLNLDYNRGKEGTKTKVSASSLDESIDVAGENSSNEIPELLECCDSLETEVLRRFYLENETLSTIAIALDCHSNTVHAIKKNALERIKNLFGN